MLTMGSMAKRPARRHNHSRSLAGNMPLPRVVQKVPPDPTAAALANYTRYPSRVIKPFESLFVFAGRF